MRVSEIQVYLSLKPQFYFLGSYLDILKDELAFSMNCLYFEASLDIKWPFLGVFSCSGDRLLIYAQKKLKNGLSGLILKTPLPNLEGELSFT